MLNFANVMDTPISIMLFDDNKRIRDSLSLIFSTYPFFDWKGAHMDATEVMDLMEIGAPDVVLMDIDMPFVGGIEATAAIRKKFPKQVIMMLTVFEDEEEVFNAICCGASGYITKSKSLSRLVGAVKEVQNGGAPITSSVARKVLQLLRQKNDPGDADHFKLTEREEEVLSYLVNGDSYKMIAQKMKICYDAVHGHIKHIYKKLHVNSGSEAVAKVLRERLISTDIRPSASSN